MRWSVVAPGRGASGVAARRRAAPVATGSRPAPMTATRTTSIAAKDAAAARSGVRDRVRVMTGSGRWSENRTNTLDFPTDWLVDPTEALEQPTVEWSGRTRRRRGPARVGGG